MSRLILLIHRILTDKLKLSDQPVGRLSVIMAILPAIGVGVVLIKFDVIGNGNHIENMATYFIIYALFYTFFYCYNSYIIKSGGKK